jgi:hypothetical protein
VTQRGDESKWLYLFEFYFVAAQMFGEQGQKVPAMRQNWTAGELFQ